MLHQERGAGMTTNQLALKAKDNLFRMRENPYPGRGIVVGLDGTGEYVVQVYWIMGRSPNSRNRIFEADANGRLYTEAADPSKVEDPSLIIYNAMRETVSETAKHYIVSNGDQTDVVAEKLGSMDLLQSVLRDIKYESDKPNFTQRITATVSLIHGVPKPFVQMSILRKSQFGDGCDAMHFSYECFRAGIGFCITTYAGDGDPLPPFYDDPLLMPLPGDILGVTNAYWEALNEKNRVSLAVKFIELASGRSTIRIINKYERVKAS